MKIDEKLFIEEEEEEKIYLRKSSVQRIDQSLRKALK
jgi:hypothetical protein